MQKRTGRRVATGASELRVAPPQRGAASHRGDVLGLQALLALHDLEAHLLAFGQRAVARAVDRAEVYEHVRAVVAADEAEAFAVVEPFDGADLPIRHVLALRTLTLPVRTPD